MTSTKRSIVMAVFATAIAGTAVAQMTLSRSRGVPAFDPFNPGSGSNTGWVTPVGEDTAAGVTRLDLANSRTVFVRPPFIPVPRTPFAPGPR
jgi:hypothetical protein